MVDASHIKITATAQFSYQKVITDWSFLKVHMEADKKAMPGDFPSSVDSLEKITYRVGNKVFFDKYSMLLYCMQMS